METFDKESDLLKFLCISDSFAEDEGCDEEENTNYTWSASNSRLGSHVSVKRSTTTPDLNLEKAKSMLKMQYFV